MRYRRRSSNSTEPTVSIFFVSGSEFISQVRTPAGDTLYGGNSRLLTKARSPPSLMASAGPGWLSSLCSDMERPSQTAGTGPASLGAPSFPRGGLVLGLQLLDLRQRFLGVGERLGLAALAAEEDGLVLDH